MIPAPMVRPANNRFAGRLYPLEHFDRSMSLKPPAGLFVCLLFLCRDFLFAVVAATGSLRGGGVDMSSLLAQHHRGYFVIGLIPAVLVFWAYTQRTPDGGTLARWTWKHGIWLLTASLTIQSVPALLALTRGKFFGADLLASPWVLFAGGVMLLYLFKSARVRDAFSDFPPR